MSVPAVSISCAFPEGFGFGDPDGISARARQAMPGNEDLSDTIDTALHDTARLLVPIDADPETGHPLDDDGCGDGRAVHDETGAVYTNGKTFNRSLNRAKVMGGGATMAAAARIGLGDAADEELGATFLHAALALRERNIGFGAHTDTNGDGSKSGCGAIDRAVPILQAIGREGPAITHTLASLGFVTDPLTQLDGKPGILANFAIDAGKEAYHGRQVSDLLLNGDARAVFKRLAGEHQETRIVLNLVPGFTIDQSFVRDATGGRAQTFAVDVWRLQRLAHGLYDTPPTRNVALLAMLAYTLGTAAVLTAGDLPVYVVSASA